MTQNLINRSVEDIDEVDQIWKNLRECINDVATEICGKDVDNKKQKWMTEEILRVMEERQSYKNNTTDEGKAKYQELKSKVQMLCRKAKDRYFEDKCLELEMLDKTHSQKLYDKVKELQFGKHRVTHQIKDKNDKLLQSKTEIVERWAEYVEE